MKIAESHGGNQIQMLSEKDSILSSPNKDLTKTNLRYAVLAFATCLTIGSFYIYDNPAALQTELQSVIFI